MSFSSFYILLLLDDATNIQVCIYISIYSVITLLIKQFVQKTKIVHGMEQDAVKKETTKMNASLDSRMEDAMQRISVDSNARRNVSSIPLLPKKIEHFESSLHTQFFTYTQSTLVIERTY